MGHDLSLSHTEPTIVLIRIFKKKFKRGERKIYRERKKSRAERWLNEKERRKNTERGGGADERRRK
jgi:hypothetical protein